MNLRFRVILLFMLIGNFFLSTAVLQAQDISPEEKFLAIEAQSEKMINRVDKRVQIIIYLKNVSDQPLEVTEPAIDEKSFLVDITMPDGKKDKLLDIYGLRLDTVRLYPRKRIKFKAYFVPELPGNYEIKVSYRGYNNEVLKAAPINIFVVNPKAKTQKE